MWCSNCGQDVPGFAAAPGGLPACARCGQPVSGSESDPGVMELKQAAAHGIDIESASPLDFDDWELDAEFSQLRGRVRRFETVAAHAPHLLVPPPLPLSPWASDARAAGRAETSKSGGAGRVSVLAWSVLSFGFMAFVCGAVLLGWSWAADRQELWQLGLPFAVAGQVGLLIGLVLQLERIWQGSRDAASKLEHVDQELHQLKNAANMLGTTHGSASQAFYSHMAEGASAQLLLADLKGQLDLLALRMSQHKS